MGSNKKNKKAKNERCRSSNWKRDREYRTGSVNRNPSTSIASNQTYKNTAEKKSAKNVVLLAVSTLQFQKQYDEQKKEQVEIPGALIESNFRYVKQEVGDKKLYSEYSVYNSTSEPISRMIKEKEGSLDYAIILATKETEKEKDVAEKYIYNNNSENLEKISPVKFYCKKIGLSKENMEKVEYDENMGADSLREAIYKIIDIIRDYWNKYKNEYKVRLWVDTQGGFRDASLALNAIVSLLNNEGIIPEDILYIKPLGQNNYEIEKKTEIYQIFDFVSGMNELRTYGSADQLYNYYNKQNNLPEEIKIMKQMSDAIRMCNVIEFDNKLSELRSKWKNFKENSASSSLLSIFIEQIEKDYGNMLKSHDCRIDIIKWMTDKKMYQQALTYIEAFMPEHWHEKVFSYDIFDIDKPPANADVYDKKSYEDDEHFVLNSIGYKIFNTKHADSIAYTSIEDIKTKADRVASNDEYEDDFYRMDKQESYSKYAYSIPSDKYKNFVRIVKLYSTLKAERNLLNHMSKDSKMADAKKLEKFIRTFIEWEQDLYKD